MRAALGWLGWELRPGLQSRLDPPYGELEEELAAGRGVYRGDGEGAREKALADLTDAVLGPIQITVTQHFDVEPGVGVVGEHGNEADCAAVHVQKDNSRAASHVQDVNHVTSGGSASASVVTLGELQVQLPPTDTQTTVEIGELENNSNIEVPAQDAVRTQETRHVAAENIIDTLQTAEESLKEGGVQQRQVLDSDTLEEKLQLQDDVDRMHTRETVEEEDIPYFYENLASSYDFDQSFSADTPHVTPNSQGAISYDTAAISCEQVPWTL